MRIDPYLKCSLLIVAVVVNALALSVLLSGGHGVEQHDKI